MLICISSFIMNVLKIILKNTIFNQCRINYMRFVGTRYSLYDTYIIPFFHGKLYDLINWCLMPTLAIFQLYRGYMKLDRLNFVV